MISRGCSAFRTRPGSPISRCGLTELGVEVVSSGGTAAAIANAGVAVTLVSDVTGFQEILGGRLKTLHPKIHGGILADRDNPEHLAELAEQGIEPIDLVVCNLYPFEHAVAHPSVKERDAIEQIDIGGPAMVRAAAKNFHSVAVVVRPSMYDAILEELESAGRSRSPHAGPWPSRRSGTPRPTMRRSPVIWAAASPFPSVWWSWRTR